jgi:hypothetical protein
VLDLFLPRLVRLARLVGFVLLLSMFGIDHERGLPR